MLRTSFATRSNDVTNSPARVDEPEAPTTTAPSAVLLVARDLSLDASCRRSLSDAGVDVVVSVSNGTRAMELLSASQLFDAVVIGVGPGDVDAANLAQHMRRHRSNTPTVVMSPIRQLDIPGSENQPKPVCDPSASQQADGFRKTIREAVAIRRFARLRRSP